MTTLIFDPQTALSEYHVILQTTGPRTQNFVDEGFYCKIDSTNPYTEPNLTSKEEQRVGLLDRSEHLMRLDQFKPVFDYQDEFPLSHDTSQLIKEYFEFRDPYISDYASYRQEIIETSKRLKKLTKIEGIQILATYSEEKNILKTLEQFYSANGSERIAFFIFENMPEGKTRDRTRVQINKFRRKFPRAIVYHIFKKFQTRGRIGLIRRMSTDIAIMHYYLSGYKSNPPIFLTDADCISVQKGFFTQAMKKFKRNPNLDAIEMKVNQPDEFKLKIPTLWIFLRIHDFTFNHLRRRKSEIKEIRMYGRAGAIKLSSYLMIHGHCPRTKLAEDIELSWALANARHQCEEDKGYFEYNLQGIVTNPRREAETYYYNKSFFEMYDTFDDNDNIRNLDWKDLLKKFPQDSVIDQKILEEEINKLINYFKNLEYDIQEIKKNIITGARYAGIKITIDDENIAIIINCTKAQNKLKHLKNSHQI